MKVLNLYSSYRPGSADQSKNSRLYTMIHGYMITRVHERVTLFLASFLVSTCIASSCKPRVEYQMIKGSDTLTYKFDLERAEARNYKMINVDDRSYYYIYHITPSHAYHCSYEEYFFYKYIGSRIYIIKGKNYIVEGYSSIWPIIYDTHQGLFYNDELGVVHMISYDGGGYLQLTHTQSKDDHIISLLNKEIRSDTSFYYQHYYTVPEVSN